MKKVHIWHIAAFVLLAFGATAQNVGIGTNTPLSKLAVKGGVSVGNTYSNLAAPVNGIIIEGSVGIGTSSPNAGAVLDLSGSSKTVMLPRMTTLQRTSLASPQRGMFVYDLDQEKIYFHDGNSWKALHDGGGANGTTGPTGPKGSTGPQGATGAQGDPGQAGINGMDGANGSPGAKGATGSTGPEGVRGATGSTGVTGATGSVGSGTAIGNTTYWDGTQWVLNNNNIYNAGANVGIGNAIPSHKLDVTGSGRFTDSLTIGEYTLPKVDGVDGQVLKTNGAGRLTWQADAGGSGPVFYDGITLSFNTCPNNLVLEDLDMQGATYARIVFPNNSGCSYKLGGIKGGSAGKMIVIFNDGTGKLGGVSNSSGSTAANRLFVTGNMNSNQTSTVATLVYDGDLQKWITISIN
jgi:hypothetical protein